MQLPIQLCEAAFLRLGVSTNEQLGNPLPPSSNKTCTQPTHLLLLGRVARGIRQDLAHLLCVSQSGLQMGRV